MVWLFLLWICNHFGKQYVWQFMNMVYPCIYLDWSFLCHIYEFQCRGFAHFFSLKEFLIIWQTHCYCEYIFYQNVIFKCLLFLNISTICFCIQQSCYPHILILVIMYRWLFYFLNRKSCLLKIVITCFSPNKGLKN